MKDTPWINAGKVLPEEKTRVIVCTKTKKGVMNINIAYHSDGMWHGNGSMSGVIAWKPLPDFPEWGDDKAVESWNRRAEAVKDQPDGDVVEVRHGKWDYEISDVGWTDYSCSVCRNIITVEGQDEDLYSYCPYCGAKMDGKVGADNA